MTLKKDSTYKKYTPKSLYSYGKYIFLSNNSYNISHIIIFNISISDILVFSILKMIRMI